MSADNDTSYSVKSIAFIGVGTFDKQAQLNLPVPIKVVLGMVDCIEGTNRNIITDNFHTSLTLAKKLNRRNLTLIGKTKKNKNCISPSFLEKSDEGTVHYGFDKKNRLTLLSVTQKNKKVVFLSSMHSNQSKDCYRQAREQYTVHICGIKLIGCAICLVSGIVTKAAMPSPKSFTIF